MDRKPLREFRTSAVVHRIFYETEQERRHQIWLIGSAGRHRIEPDKDKREKDDINKNDSDYDDFAPQKQDNFAHATIESSWRPGVDDGVVTPNTLEKHLDAVSKGKKLEESCSADNSKKRAPEGGK